MKITNSHTLILRSLLTLFFLLMTNNTLAAVIFMKNGDRITGEVLSVNENEIQLRTPYSTVIFVERKFVKKMEGVVAHKASSKPEHVEKTVVAEVSETESRIVHKPKDWQARVDLTSSLSKGNNDSHTLALQGNWQRRHQQNSYMVDFKGRREEQEGKLVDKREKIDLGINYHLEDGWFYAVNARWESSDAAFVDSRYSVHPSIGRTLWSDNRKTLSVQMDTGYSWEESPRSSEQSELVGLQVNFNYRFPSGRASAYLKNHAYKNLDGLENVISKTEVGVQYPLNEHIYLKLQLDYDYNSKPFRGADKEDIVLTAGAGVNF